MPNKTKTGTDNRHWTDREEKIILLAIQDNPNCTYEDVIILMPKRKKPRSRNSLTHKIAEIKQKHYND